MVSNKTEDQEEERKMTFAEYERELERERIRKILESAQNTINNIGNTIQKTEEVQTQLGNIQSDVKEVLKKEQAVSLRAAQLDAIFKNKYAGSAAIQAAPEEVKVKPN